MLQAKNPEAEECFPQIRCLKYLILQTEPKLLFFLNTFIFTKSQHFDGKRSVVSDIMSNDFLGTNRPIHMAAHGLYQEVKQVSQSAPIHTPKII